jgi:predicted FMN-binding regulatory protein PaiB
MHPSAAFNTDDEATLLAHLATHPFVTLAAATDGGHLTGRLMRR